MQKDLCLSNRYCAVWIGCKSGYQTENFTCSGITRLRSLPTGYPSFVKLKVVVPTCLTLTMANGITMIAAQSYS